jgi:hypothetical protein
MRLDRAQLWAGAALGLLSRIGSRSGLRSIRSLARWSSASRVATLPPAAIARRRGVREGCVFVGVGASLRGYGLASSPAVLQASCSTSASPNSCESRLLSCTPYMNTNNSAAGRAGLRTVAIGQKVLISRSSTGDKASQFWLGTKLNLLPSRITKFILPELLYEALPNVPFISDLSTKSLLRK